MTVVLVGFPRPIPVDPPAWLLEPRKDLPCCLSCGHSDLAHGDRAVRACDGDAPLPVGHSNGIHCPYPDRMALCLCTGWSPA